ncbi:MAG: flagellar protein FlaG [Maledivibacter sp.]|jgi:flagellar protein FlaG|nr:flagellar protein FlaG [Maledivibacter sp.]
MRIEGVTGSFSSESLSNNVDSNNAYTVHNVNKSENSENAQLKTGEQNDNSNIKLSEKSIKEAIESTNKKLEATDRKFEFSVNEETNDIIVKVINKETDEVIREIPSEKILDMVAKMMELAGIFVDERR